MKNLIALTALLSLFTQSASAIQCSSLLQASSSDYYIELPGKGNQFSERGFKGLSKNNQDLVLSLQDALESLESPEIVEQIVLLNQPLDHKSLNTAEHLSAPLFFKKELQDKAYEKTALENYVFLKTKLKTTFPDSTLAGLSLLYKNIRRSEKQQPLSTSEQTAANKSTMLRFAKVVNQKRYAKAVLEIIGNERAKEDLSSLLLDKSRYDFDSTVDLEKTLHVIEKDLLIEVSVFEKSYAVNNKFSRKHINALGLRFFNLMNILDVHLENALEQNQDHMGLEGRSFKEVSRDLRLDLIETVILEIFGTMKNLRAVVLFVDHGLTGEPLPLEGNEHERLVLESLNSSLVAVRNQVSQNRLERKQDKARAENFSKAPIFNKESPLFVKSEPKKEYRNPNKRRNQRGHRKDRVKRSEDKRTAVQIEEIPDEINLVHFSGLSKNQVDFNKLKSGQEYQLRFLREEADSPVQKVVFETGVLKDLFSDKELAVQFMRALNLGHAIRTHQDGLKILKATDLNGRLYELKLRKSDHRLILSHNNGSWRVLKMTDKKNFDRTVNSLGKFYRRSNGN